MSKRSVIVPLVAVGGGVGLIAGAVALYLRGRSRTVDSIAGGGTVKIHATGYWPFTARHDERKMEGGILGAAAWNKKRVVDPRTGKRIQLHTLEQHLANPALHPEVSVSGDPTIWPFGQRISLSPWPTAVFRIVDTGSHFTGVSKVYRVIGEEPLDICVDSSKTAVPKKNVVATVFAGDNWESGRAVSYQNLAQNKAGV